MKKWLCEKSYRIQRQFIIEAPTRRDAELSLGNEDGNVVHILDEDVVYISKGRVVREMQGQKE